MQGKHLYEYTVVRIVPKIEREEFINVGVILYAKQSKFIDMRYHLDPQKLQAFCPDLDLEQIEKNLEAFKAISLGQKEAGRIAEMDMASRFRWLTATRSSVIQTSKTHPGFSDSLPKTVDCLFNELVL